MRRDAACACEQREWVTGGGRTLWKSASCAALLVSVILTYYSLKNDIFIYEDLIFHSAHAFNSKKLLAYAARLTEVYAVAGDNLA